MLLGELQFCSWVARGCESIFFRRVFNASLEVGGPVEGQRKVSLVGPLFFNLEGLCETTMS